MIRNLLGRSRVGAICVGACLALFASPGWSLGLGEIEIDSSLNEKLDAEIELLDVSGLQPSEILVSLASNADFERVGVERFFFLTDLHFEVTYGAGGKAKVAVSSSQPVTEPYLNFLVEVVWPSGRLLKEYTLLLDPPTFSQAAAPAVSAPRQGQAPSQTAGRVERPAAARSGTQVQMTPDAKRPASRSPLDNELMTDRDDTLWAIASRNRASSAISVQQNMLAIQRLNPEAFINNNINLLKAGYVLRMPSEAEASSLSNEEALAAVNTQNEEWRSYVRGETPRGRTAPQTEVAARGSELQGQVDATSNRGAARTGAAAPEGELRIVAGTGDSATGRASEATADELNAAREEQDRLGREVDELTYKLDREQELAKNQLEVKERQLEVKDQQIAELQAQMAQMQQQLAERQQNQNQSTSAADTSEPWWQSPYVLGAAAGVLVLALVGGLIVARRSRESGDEFYPVDDAATEARREPKVSGEAEDFTAEDLTEFDTEVDDERMSSDDTQTVEMDDDEVHASQTGDVIGEADIYIAYGRYPQAIGLLLGVLEDDPDRNDVRLKLLELYVETSDREAFETHMAELVKHCDDEDALLTARELEARLVENDFEVGQTSEAATETKTRPTPAADELAGVDDFDLDLDADEPAGEIHTPAAEDFELELDDTEELAEISEDDGAGDQLGGDLGIDFDPDSDLTADSGDVQPAGGRVKAEAAGRASTSDNRAAKVMEDIDFGSDVATVEEDDFEFDDEGDSANTKLDLARAYIDMGDEDGARDILNEVLEEGNSDQRQQARSMLDGL